MQRRQIGRTALEVTEISFGGAALGGLYRACPRDQAMETLQAAWDSDIRYFDVAPWYGLGLAERRFGDFLRDHSEKDYVLSTKVGRLLRPVPTGTVPDYSYVDPLSFDADYDYSYDGIMRSVEFSYARLGLNKIDILYVHDIGAYTHGKAGNAHHLGQLLGSGLKALEELKSSGAISAYGLGVNEIPVCLDVMREADIDCILLAGRYTLLDRSAVADLLPLCEKNNTSLIIGGVFNSGILATGPVAGSMFDYMPATDAVLSKVAAMEEVARSHDLPLAKPALQFPLSNPIVASVLIGTAKASSLTRNMELFEPKLPQSLYAEFEDLTLVAPPLGEAAVRV